MVNPGWGGGHAYVNPLGPGRVPRALARIVDVQDGIVRFSERISFPANPMLGCVGDRGARRPDVERRAHPRRLRRSPRRQPRPQGRHGRDHALPAGQRPWRAALHRRRPRGAGRRRAVGHGHRDRLADARPPRGHSRGGDPVAVAGNRRPLDGPHRGQRLRGGATGGRRSGRQPPRARPRARAGRGPRAPRGRGRPPDRPVDGRRDPDDAAPRDSEVGGGEPGSPERRHAGAERAPAPAAGARGAVA